MSEHAVMSDEITMEQQLEKFQQLQSSFGELQEDFNYINTTGQELIAKSGGDSQSQRLKEELQDLNTKWSDIPIILEERQQKLNKGLSVL